MVETIFAFLFVIAATAADPRTLRLTLDTNSAAGGVFHVPRASRIGFTITLHKPMPLPLGPMIEVERLEVDFENRDPRYFEHRPGPNVELHVVRHDGTRRVDVPIRVIRTGSGGTVDTD